MPEPQEGPPIAASETAVRVEPGRQLSDLGKLYQRYIEIDQRYSELKQKEQEHAEREEIIPEELDNDIQEADNERREVRGPISERNIKRYPQSLGVSPDRLQELEQEDIDLHDARTRLNKALFTYERRLLQNQSIQEIVAEVEEALEDFSNKLKSHEPGYQKRRVEEIFTDLVADLYEKETQHTPPIRQLYEQYNQNPDAKRLDKVNASINAFAGGDGGDYESLSKKRQELLAKVRPLREPIDAQNKVRYPRALGIVDQDQFKQILDDNPEISEAYRWLNEWLFQYDRTVVEGQVPEQVETEVRQVVGGFGKLLKEEGIEIKSAEEVLGRLRDELGVSASATPEPTPPSPEEEATSEVEVLEGFQSDLEWLRQTWRAALDTREPRFHLDIDDPGRKYKSDEWAWRSFDGGLREGWKHGRYNPRGTTDAEKYGAEGLTDEQKLARLKDSFEYTFSIMTGVHAEVVAGREIPWKEGFNIHFAKEFLAKYIDYLNSLPEEQRGDLPRAQRVHDVLEKASVAYKTKYADKFAPGTDPLAPPKDPKRPLQHQRTKHEAYFVHMYDENGSKPFDATQEGLSHEEAMKQNYHRAMKRFDEWEVIDADELLGVFEEHPELRPTPEVRPEPTPEPEPKPQPEPPTPGPGPRPESELERPYHINVGLAARHDSDIEQAREIGQARQEEDKQLYADIPSIVGWLPIIGTGHISRAKWKNIFRRPWEPFVDAGKNIKWIAKNKGRFVTGNVHRAWKNGFFSNYFEDRDTLLAMDLQDKAKEKLGSKFATVIVGSDLVDEALRQGAARVKEKRSKMGRMRMFGSNLRDFVRDAVSKQTEAYQEAKAWFDEQLASEDADNPVAQAISRSQSESAALGRNFGRVVPMDGSTDYLPTQSQFDRANRRLLDKNETRYLLGDEQRQLVDKKLKEICTPFFSGEISEEDLLGEIIKYVRDEEFLSLLDETQKKEITTAREFATDLIEQAKFIRDNKEHYLPAEGRYNFEFNLMFGTASKGLAGEIGTTLAERIRLNRREKDSERPVTYGQGKVATAVDAVSSVAYLGTAATVGYMGGVYATKTAAKLLKGTLGRAVPFGAGMGTMSFLHESGFRVPIPVIKREIRYKGRLAREREQVGREVARGRISPEEAHLRKEIEESLPLMRKASDMIERLATDRERLLSGETLDGKEVKKIIAHLADVDARSELNAMAGEREVGGWNMQFIQWGEEVYAARDSLRAYSADVYEHLEAYIAENPEAVDVLQGRELNDVLAEYTQAQKANIIGDGQIAAAIHDDLNEAGTFVAEADRLKAKNRMFRGLTFWRSVERGTQAAVASATMSVVVSEGVHLATHPGEIPAAVTGIPAGVMHAIGTGGDIIDWAGNLSSASVKEIGGEIWQFLQKQGQIDKAGFEDIAATAKEIAKDGDAHKLLVLIEEVKKVKAEESQAFQEFRHDVGQILRGHGAPARPDQDLGLPAPGAPDTATPEALSAVSLQNFQRLYNIDHTENIPLEDGFKLQVNSDHHVFIIKPRSDGSEEIVKGFDIRLEQNGHLTVTGKIPLVERVKLEHTGFYLKQTAKAGESVGGITLEPSHPVSDGVSELHTKIPQGTEWVKDLKTDPTGRTWDLVVTKNPDVALIDNAHVDSNGMLDLSGAHVDPHLNVTPEFDPNHVLTEKTAVSHWQELGSHYKEQYYVYDKPDVSVGNELRFHTLVRHGNEVGFDMSRMKDSYQTGLDPNPLPVGDILNHAPGTEGFEPGIAFKIPGLDTRVFVPLNADGSDDKILWLSPTDTTHTVMLNGHQVTMAELYHMVVDEKKLAEQVAKLGIKDKGDIATEVHGAQDVWKLGVGDHAGRIIATVKEGDTLKDVASIEGTTGVEVPLGISVIEVTKELHIPGKEGIPPKIEVIPPKAPTGPKGGPTQVPPTVPSGGPSGKMPTEEVTEKGFIPVPFDARRAVERSKAPEEKLEIRGFEPIIEPEFTEEEIEKLKEEYPDAFFPPLPPGPEAIPEEQFVMHYELLPKEKGKEKEYPREPEKLSTEEVARWMQQNLSKQYGSMSLEDVKKLVEQEDERARELAAEFAKRNLVEETYKQLNKFLPQVMPRHAAEVPHSQPTTARVNFYGRFRLMAQANNVYAGGYFNPVSGEVAVDATSVTGLPPREREQAVKELIARAILGHEFSHGRSEEGMWYWFQRATGARGAPTPEERATAGLVWGRLGISMFKIRPVKHKLADGSIVIADVVVQEMGRWLNEAVTEELTIRFMKETYGEEKYKTRAYPQEREVLRRLITRLENEGVSFEDFAVGMLNKKGFVTLVRSINGIELIEETVEGRKLRRKAEVSRPYFLHIIYALMEYEQAVEPYRTTYSLTKKFIGGVKFDENDRRKLQSVIRFAYANERAGSIDSHGRTIPFPQRGYRNIQLNPTIRKHLQETDWISKHYSFIGEIGQVTREEQETRPLSLAESINKQLKDRSSPAAVRITPKRLADFLESEVRLPAGASISNATVKIVNNRLEISGIISVGGKNVPFNVNYTGQLTTDKQGRTLPEIDESNTGVDQDALNEALSGVRNAKARRSVSRWVQQFKQQVIAQIDQGLIEDWETLSFEIDGKTLKFGFQKPEKKKAPEATRKPKSEFDVEIEEVSDEEAKQILKKTEIHGHPFNGRRLTRKDLEREGLLPKYKARFGESDVWFSSSAYDLGKGRMAVVAYVQKGKEIIARSYYLSNSQGVWRYMPNYLQKNAKDGRMVLSWYSKGFGEESITLPIVVQRILAEIAVKPVKKIKDPEFVFAGTARDLVELQRQKKNGTYYIDVESIPQRLAGQFHTSSKKLKVKPEQMRFAHPESSPDFSKMLTSWPHFTKQYGTIQIEVYPSKDGNLKYMFCRDSKDRVWIGGIENNSRMQSTGLRRLWVNGGDLVTPAYEYKTARVDQTGGYGNERMRSGPYVDMFENYLSKIPVIQEYLQVKGLLTPQRQVA